MSKEYWWVSIGGNPYEPAVVVTEKKIRKAFTIGCPDPFVLPSDVCQLVRLLPKPPNTPAEAKQKAKQKSDAADAYEKQRIGMRFSHGYRKF